MGQVDGTYHEVSNPRLVNTLVVGVAEGKQRGGRPRSAHMCQIVVGVMLSPGCG